jgi:hypothetical protein
MSLNDDDKTWISQQVATQIATLGKTIDDRIDRLDGRFERLDDRFKSLDDRIDHLDDKIERLETTLLTEFHKWASPQEARMRTHAAALRAVDLEMEAVSDRLKKLEDQRPH